MNPQPRNTRGVLLASAVAVLVIACSSTPNQGTPAEAGASQYTQYKYWPQLMENEMRPIQDAFIDELTKDPEDVDYQFIGDRSRRTAYYFGLFFDKNSHFYDDSKDERAFARKAQAWLLDMARAADQKDQGTLVRLFVQRAKICTQCHDEV
ncbi:MAG: hypothetical protein ACYTKC_07225 [Planctomycetota bacterium]|jgi:hypothetical protein